MVRGFRFLPCHIWVLLIRRALQGATSVWDQVWSLGLAGWSPTWCWVQLRKNMLPLDIWEVICFYLKLLFDLVDLTCIFLYDAERSSDPNQYLLKEGFLALLMRHVTLGCNQSWWSLQVILGHNLPWCDSMLEMANVKFDYFKEKLGVLEIEVPSKEKWWDRETFWHGRGLSSFHGQM